MKSEMAHAKTFQLSKSLSVEITAGAGGVICEWLPAVPKRMTPTELINYRKALAEMVKRIDGRVLVIEAPGGK